MMRTTADCNNLRLYLLQLLLAALYISSVVGCKRYNLLRTKLIDYLAKLIS